jgi:hypothetical protein
VATYVNRRLHAGWNAGAFEDDRKLARNAVIRPGQIANVTGKCPRIFQFLLNVSGNSSFHCQTNLSETVLQGEVDTTIVNITDCYS